MTQAQAGDLDAFTGLVRRYESLVAVVAFGRLGNTAEAEEIAQETFLKAHRSLAQLKDPRSFKGWLLMIAKRLCADRGRLARVQRPSQALSPEMEDPRTASGLQHLEDSESRARITEAVSRLPEDLRTVVTLKYLQDLSYDRISELTGWSAVSVGERLWRARDLLREVLSRD